MLVALATDPIAGLVDTALVGQLGLGVALSIFNTLNKFLTVPLVSATTTLVAEALGTDEARALARASVAPTDSDTSQHEGDIIVVATATEPKKALPSDASDDLETPLLTAPSSSNSWGHGEEKDHGEGQTNVASDALTTSTSAALIVALVFGLVESVLIFFLAHHALAAWGLPRGTPAHEQGAAYLKTRALGVTFTVLLLTLQGVFRGLHDTRTPLAASLSSNIINVILCPLFIFWLHWGVVGAAIAVSLAQVLPTVFLLFRLGLQVKFWHPTASAMVHLVELLKPSGLLLLRTASVTATYAFATSVLARSGSEYAAAHQVAISVWLATTLLADALAVAAQALLARYSALGNIPHACLAAERCVTLGGALGVITAVLVWVLKSPIAHLFTSDAEVLDLLAKIMPVLILTQPVNMLAFTWDGVLFGAGGFRYASVAMAVCALPACALIRVAAIVTTPDEKLLWVWSGLGVLMACRAVSIWVPWLAKIGPFAKLRRPSPVVPA